jgi:hypothetical protein
MINVGGASVRRYAPSQEIVTVKRSRYGERYGLAAWARVAQLEMELDGKNIAQYRATTKIYFDIEP